MIDSYLVDILPFQWYLGPISKVSEGSLAITHTAYVKFSESGPAIESFVKVYKGSGREILNEVTGYVIADAAGIPIPKNIAIAFLEPSEFVPDNGQERVMALVTSEVKGETPNQTYGVGNAQNDPQFHKALKSWGGLHKLIAVDSWLINQDRNGGNLVRTDAGYVAIDHGEVMSGGYSSLSDLDVNRVYVNQLIEILWKGYQNVPVSDGLELLQHSDDHKEIYDSVEEELKFWVNSVLQAPNDKQLFLWIISVRSKQTKLLQNHLGMLDLVIE